MLFVVLGPDLFYCFLLAEAVGDFGAWDVCPVPVDSVDGVGQGSAGGHLEIAVGVGFTDQSQAYLSQ